MQRALSTHLFVNHRLTVALLTGSAGGHSGGGDLLRAAAPGLPQPGADRRTGPLVPRFRTEAAFAACADVHRRDLGPLGPARGGHHHRAGESPSGWRWWTRSSGAVEVAEVIPFRYLIQHIGVSARRVRRAQGGRGVLGAGGTELVRPPARRADPAGEHPQRAFERRSGWCSSWSMTHLPLQFVFDVGHANHG